MDTNPNIVMSGYYGFQNAGDDAVCYAVIEALRQEMPDCSLTVLSGTPELTEDVYNVQAVDRWKYREVWRALRKADMLVSGGGSLIQDVTSKNSCLYYLGVIFMAMLQRKPVVVYGQGLGPLTNSRNKRLTRRIFNHVRAIYVRDEESHSLLRAIGVKTPIQVAPDPVLGIDNEVVDTEKGLAILKQLGYKGDRPLALMALRDWKELDHVHEFAALGDYLTNQGFQVGLLAMHYDQDDVIAKAVDAHMRGDSFVISDAYDTPTLFSVFDNASVVVGMRLHACIIGAALDKRVMAISYDPKVNSFMKMIHNPHILDLDAVSEERLQNMADSCLHTAKPEVAHRMRELKRLAHTPAQNCRDILAQQG